MHEIPIDLTFPSVTLSKAGTPWNLTPLLYSGGAATDIRIFASSLVAGSLGTVIEDRISLVTKIHEVILGELAGGWSRTTARICIASVKYFFTWADQVGASLTLETVEQTFIDWTAHLLHRQHETGDLSHVSVYGRAAIVSTLLSRALDLRVHIIRRTQITKNTSKKPVLSARAETKHLVDTFSFGNTLLDISEALTLEVVYGPLPVKIIFRDGRVIEEWAGLQPDDKLKTLTSSMVAEDQKKTVRARRLAHSKNISIQSRYAIFNLRIEAEMLIFIAQTGMNLAQAYRLKSGQFFYQSYLGGYEVRRVYKARRQGEVEFVIYAEYRPLFERYLKWRSAIYSGTSNDLLFPLMSPQKRAHEIAPTIGAIQRRCLRLGISYIGPNALRKTRINWLARKLSDDSLTAQMAQHTEETLVRSYLEPHHQTTVQEISRFHAHSDPSIEPPGPGTCILAFPQPIVGLPSEASKPDCISPAGCLFCTHQRDIDSADHSWSLASYRFLKSLELVSYRHFNGAQTSHPSMLAIARVTEKLNFFKQSNVLRLNWVEEAEARVVEGDYHPKWDGFIKLMELR